MRAALICLLLAGCCTTAPAPVVINNDCSWIPKLTTSSKDTPETKRLILAYAKAYNQNCPR
jgi:hypothetical protein